MVFTIVVAIIVVWAALIVLCVIGWALILALGWVWWKLFPKSAHTHIWPADPIIVMRCEECGVDTVIYKVEDETTPLY